MPFTMLPLDTSIPRVPHYTTICIRSVYEHVWSVIPSYLQGTDGIIRLIASFVGTNYKWVQVLGDMDEVYRNRNEDLYFLFWVCSHRLPIPESFEELRSQWNRSAVSTRRTHCVDTGSKMFPVGKCGLYYTRSGHLGTAEDLARLTRTVSCMGYVTPIRPVLSTIGKHAIVTRRPEHWQAVVGTHTDTVQVVHVDTIHHRDPEIHWDTVVLDLDSIRPSETSKYYTVGDYRHMSGSICSEWVRIHTAFLLRKMTIIYTEVPPSSTLDILEYMFLLRTKYMCAHFVDENFTCGRSSFMRLAETMLLEGMLGT
jgi:hypothetical protein